MVSTEWYPSKRFNNLGKNCYCYILRSVEKLKFKNKGNRKTTTIKMSKFILLCVFFYDICVLIDVLCVTIINIFLFIRARYIKV